MSLPAHFTDDDHLEDVMSTPSAALAERLRRAPGDIVVLGVGGKMGPTLACMTRRADPARRVIGVARFSSPGLRDALTGHGIECIEADLLSRDALAALPDAPNVVFMAGRKFGSTGSVWLTWAMNALVPAMVAERHARSRIVAFSTACVYPFVDAAGPGAAESMPPTASSGEYANSCVARERLFQHVSHLHATPGRLLRLSYAIDVRYGVLHDVARAERMLEALARTGAVAVDRDRKRQHLELGHRATPAAGLPTCYNPLGATGTDLRGAPAWRPREYGPAPEAAQATSSSSANRPAAVLERARRPPVGDADGQRRAVA